MAHNEAKKEKMIKCLPRVEGLRELENSSIGRNGNHSVPALATNPLLRQRGEKGGASVMDRPSDSPGSQQRFLNRLPNPAGYRTSQPTLGFQAEQKNQVLHNRRTKYEVRMNRCYHLSKKWREKGFNGLDRVPVSKHRWALSREGVLDLSQDRTNQAPKVPDNIFSLLEDDNVCQKRDRLLKDLEMCVRHISECFLLEICEQPTPLITCGGLRSAVRSYFDPILSEVAELSIKTAQKLERTVCDVCSKKQDPVMKEWIEERFRPVEVNDKHINAFRIAFGCNVDQGWNKTKYPYIPNGHGTLFNTRKDGGNWNKEPYQDYCNPVLVMSSGKPRVVTTFAENNTRTLTPLHLSLYKNLSKKGWLLVGSPTDERVNKLKGGDFISIDYRSATDNIKTAYTRTAIEVLISKAEGLTDHEITCLRTLGELRFECLGEIATRGQPMGSVFSFPLLCLINKTVNDMALIPFLKGGQIDLKSWRSHPLLINGDDCLTREVIRDRTRQAPKVPEELDFPDQGSLLKNIEFHGKEVGLVLNLEKSMVSPSKAEINSTLFEKRGEMMKKIKKVNLSALRMRPEVNDVLGEARAAAQNVEQFKCIVRRNAHILAKQTDKTPSKIPIRYKLACIQDKKILRALQRQPDRVQPESKNWFPVTLKPVGYDLTREEEVRALNERVEWIRSNARTDKFFHRGGDGICRFPNKVTQVSIPDVKFNLRHFMKPKRKFFEEERILCALSDFWLLKEKQKLLEKESCLIGYGELEIISISDQSPINALIAHMRQRRVYPQNPSEISDEDMIALI
nr:MAG: RNA-dependent RNA polymerase [Yellow silver pine associated botourmia-like virus 26]